MKADTVVLLVMPRYCRAELLEILEGSVTHVLAVCNCEEARRVLDACLPVSVVFTGATLPDGEWVHVLEDVERNGLNAQVVVCGPRLSAESRSLFFARDIYDLLVEPYEAVEVKRLVESAAALCHMRTEIAGEQVSLGDDL